MTRVHAPLAAASSSAILVLADPDAQVQSIVRTLESSPFLHGTVDVARGLSRGRTLLNTRRFDAILLLPPRSRLEFERALTKVRACAPDVPIIVGQSPAHPERDLTLGRDGVSEVVHAADLESSLLPQVIRGALDRHAWTRSERERQRHDAFGLLADGFAHQYSNMLSVVLGYAAIGLAQPGLDARVGRWLRHVLRAATEASVAAEEFVTGSRPKGPTR